MATGKTNARWIVITLDDNVPTARIMSASIQSISGMGLTHDTADVTGYSDGWHNITLGHPSSPISVSGPVDNTADIGSHTVFSAIVGDQSTTHTLWVEIGIKAAPENGDPRWAGEYYCTQYTVNDDATYDAVLEPAAGTVGAWTVKS